MRKLLLICLACMILLTACATQQPTLPAVLLRIDGTTVITREDLAFAVAYEGEACTEEFFTALAEQAICAYLAEEDGVAEDEAAIRAEYEIYLENLEVTGQEPVHTALREQFPEQTDEAFDALFLAYLRRAASASAMTKTIAESYGNVVDPETIRENIRGCLTELASFCEITVSYPDLAEHIFRFESVL